MRTENKDKELNHRHFVAVRLTDIELNLLDQGAACFSISRSEYLRKLLLEKQINHQIEVVADMNDLRKLVSEYGKIGSNLNQIAKHMKEKVLNQSIFLYTCPSCGETFCLNYLILYHQMEDLIMIYLVSESEVAKTYDLFYGEHDNVVRTEVFYLPERQ